MGIALTFILNIDELICANFTSVTVGYVLEKLEEFQSADMEAEAKMTHEDVLERYTQMHRITRKDILVWFWALVPKRFLLTVLLTFWFAHDYYVRHCVSSEDGTWVSRPTYLPSSVTYSPLHLLFP